MARPAWPPTLQQDLRTDHAGETGAVQIYRGVLAVTRDPALRAFAQHHLATEQRHLADIEAVLPPSAHSRLLPLWRVAGWLTGALPALAGPAAVYATIEAVETFVDRHYAEQTAWIEGWLGDPAAGEPALRARVAALATLLEACRQDEVAHRDEAGAHAPASRGPLLRLWCALVGRGSAAAVAVCRHV